MGSIPEEGAGRGPGPRRGPPGLALIGLALALGLLWAAYLVQVGAGRELSAGARAALQAAAQERARYDALAEEHRLLLEADGARSTLLATTLEALEGAQAEREASALELASAHRRAHRARMRAADLALGAGRLEEARELLGEGPGPGAGIEWHLLDRTHGAALAPVERLEAPITRVALASEGGRWAAADLADGLRIGILGGPSVGPEEAFEDPVRGLAFDPQGEVLVAALADWTARVLSAGDGRPLARLVGHYGPVNAAAFVGGAERVATGGEDGTLRLWDLARTDRELWVAEAHGGAILDLAADGRGERLASASLDQEVKLWGTADGRLLQTLAGHTDWVHAVAFSGDGTRLASASDDGTARVWDAATGALVAVLEGHRAPLVAVWLDRRGELAVTGGEDGSVRRWDVERRRELASLRPGGLGLRALAVAADGQGLLVARGGGLLERASFVPPEPWRVLATAEAPVRALAAGTGGHLAVGHGEGQVTLLDGRRGEVLATADVGRAAILALALAGGAPGSAEPPRLALGRGDGTLSLLAGSDLRERRDLEGHGVGITAVSFSADGARLASAAYSGELSLWDFATGARIESKPGPRQLVLAVALDAAAETGAWIAGAGQVRAWNLADGERRAALRAPDLGRVTAAALGPAGQTLMTVAGELVLSSFDLGRGELRGRSEPFVGRMTALALSPDGSRAATAALDGGLDLWDARSAEHLLHLAAPPGTLAALTFTPDGRALLGALPDGRILVFGAWPAGD